MYYLFILPVERAATAGRFPALGVTSNLEMGPKCWQPAMRGLQQMAKNPSPFLTGEKQIFEGKNQRLREF